MLFNNIDNKTDLVKLASTFYQSQEAKQLISTPIIFNDREQTWEITKDAKAYMFDCNHKEAGTRLILHACLADINIVVVAKDTDVFVLMVFAYCVEKPSGKWFLKIDHEEYIDIGNVVDYLGEDVSRNLPAIHAATDCDTASTMFGVGKAKNSEKV